MSKNTATLALIRCPSLRPFFKESTITLKNYRSWSSALEDLSRETRIIVIHERALREDSIDNRAQSLRKRSPLAEILIWAPHASARYAREALRGGVKDVILEEDPQTLVLAIQELIRQQEALPRLLKLEKIRARRSQFQGMVSRSRVMWDLFEQCSQIAETEAPVLILGETGTGKELLARAIHRLSKREGRFVALDCGAIPENLLEAQLFGHVKGSFTGATRDKAGLFQTADQGTLFFDEIGNIAMTAQMTLLRAIQEGQVRPVGSEQVIQTNARIISATNEPLEHAVEDGSFREDLFFRLDVIRLIIPPLRQRAEDILHLLEHFLKKFKTRGSAPVQLSESFLDEVLNYPWPGNVRELENFAQRLALLYPGKKVHSQQFRRLTRSYKKKGAPLPKRAPIIHPEVPTSSPPAPEIDLNQSLDEYLAPFIERAERDYLDACLRAHRGRIGQTATKAGIHRRTLLRKLKQYNMNKNDYKKSPEPPR